MATEGTRIGAVLAGGLSQRMGRDKSGLLLEGEPLWLRQVKVLRNAGMGRVILVRRPGQPAPPGVECWRDIVEGIGPLGGLYAALFPGIADWVFVLAVDMPGIGADWFEWLSDKCEPGVGAMALHSDSCEPLACIYPAGALVDIVRQIRAKDYSVQRLARSLAGAGKLKLLPIDAAKAARAQSVNTPSLYAALAPSKMDSPVARGPATIPAWRSFRAAY